MRKLIVYSLVSASLLMTSSHAISQYYFYNNDYYEADLTIEIGGSAGGMNCLTDLGGRKGAGGKFIKDINWNKSRPCAGLYAGVYYRSAIGLRLAVNLGGVAASDDVLKNDQSLAYARFLRNLSFRSSVREALLLGEFHPLMVNGSKAGCPVISPYIYAGIGYFAFNPEAPINNTWIRLAGMHTEGQGFKEYPERRAYQLSQFNFPVGAGLKYEASPVFCLGLEVTYRVLDTDYLDDVSKTYVNPELFSKYLPSPVAALAEDLSDRGLSPAAGNRQLNEKRGNDKNDDAYFSFDLKLAVVIGRQRR